jgi:small GTP-binding protein
MASKNYKIKVLSMDPGEFDLSFKLIVIGDSGVGKSCLAIKATKDTFDTLYSPTIGFEFMTFFIKVEEVNIKLQIWDTCGQEVYRSLINSFYHNSSLAFLVYAINDKISFNNLESWLNEIRTTSNPDVNIFIIGNKVDLENERAIPKDVGQGFADTHDAKLFIETSAKTGFNAQNILIEAAKLLYEQHLLYKNRVSRPESLTNLNNNNGVELIEEEQNIKNRRKGCC